MPIIPSQDEREVTIEANPVHLNYPLRDILRWLRRRRFKVCLKPTLLRLHWDVENWDAGMFIDEATIHTRHCCLRHPLWLIC